MKINKILLITSILLLFVSCSNVYAEDNFTNSIGNDVTENIVSIYQYNQEIELSNDDIISSYEDEIISEKDNCTFTALQKKIDNTIEGSTISLENNYTYDEDFSLNRITINKSLTINGNGYTIDAKSKSGIIYLSGKNIILKNSICVGLHYLRLRSLRFLGLFSLFLNAV